ncbi:hypothetical protein FPV67DRAFT_1708204 [Lyophyllum atratum]|nr:hypothetical protein FPV67DRAFT_1708204 [Lyophyllum atratum]
MYTGDYDMADGRGKNDPEGAIGEETGQAQPRLRLEGVAVCNRVTTRVAQPQACCLQARVNPTLDRWGRLLVSPTSGTSPLSRGEARRRTPSDVMVVLVQGAFVFLTSGPNFCCGLINVGTLLPAVFFPALRGWDLVDSRGSFGPNTAFETDAVTSRGGFCEEKHDESINIIIRPTGLRRHGRKTCKWMRECVSKMRSYYDAERDIKIWVADQHVTENVTLNLTWNPNWC